MKLTGTKQDNWHWQAYSKANNLQMNFNKIVKEQKSGKNRYLSVCFLLR